MPRYQEQVHYNYKSGKLLQDIIRIMTSDPRLVSAWAIIARELRLDSKDISKIRKDYPDEEITYMLEYWISKEGSKATINELINALQTKKFANVAEWISQRCPNKSTKLSFYPEPYETEIKPANQINQTVHNNKNNDNELSLKNNNQTKKGVENTPTVDVDDGLKELYESFEQMDVDKFHMALENVKDPKCSKKDSKLVNGFLKKHQIDLGATVKRHGISKRGKPKQMRIELHGKKGEKIQESIVKQCLSALRGDRLLQNENIKILDRKEAEFAIAEEKKRSSFSTMLLGTSKFIGFFAKGFEKASSLF